MSRKRLIQLSERLIIAPGLRYSKWTNDQTHQVPYVPAQDRGRAMFVPTAHSDRLAVRVRARLPGVAPAHRHNHSIHDSHTRAGGGTGLSLQAAFGEGVRPGRSLRQQPGRYRSKLKSRYWARPVREVGPRCCGSGRRGLRPAA